MIIGPSKGGLFLQGPKGPFRDTFPWFHHALLYVSILYYDSSFEACGMIELGSWSPCKNHFPGSCPSFA